MNNQWPDEKKRIRKSLAAARNSLAASNPEHTYTSRDGAGPDGSLPKEPPSYDSVTSATPPALRVNSPTDEKNEDFFAHDHSSSHSSLTPYSYATSGVEGSASSPGSSGEKSSSSLLSFFGSQGPPAGFTRVIPSNISFESFEPLCLLSNSHKLIRGFPLLPPPCDVQPHPFSTHDVTVEDWKRFLGDIKKAATLSPGQRVRANVIPFVAGVTTPIGPIFSFIIARSVTKKLQYKNRTAAGDVVDHWNHYFFNPRRLEVVLSQGLERLSGKAGMPPPVDADQQRLAENLRQNPSSESLSSAEGDSEEVHFPEPGHQAHSPEPRHQANFPEPHLQAPAPSNLSRRQEKMVMVRDRNAYKKSGDARQLYELILVPF